MSGIFISYSRKDEIFARRLAASLEQMGGEVWIDVDDIHAGLKWSDAIQQGLDAADVMLVILSPDSMASNNVEDEWQYFLDHRKPVIPILLREAKIHFQLNRIQWIDFLNQPYERALIDLHEELSKKGVKVRKPADVTAVSISKQEVQNYAQAAKPVSAKSPLPLQLVMGVGIGAIAMLAVFSVFMLAQGNKNDNQTTPTVAAQVEVTENPTATDRPDNTNTPSDVPTNTDVPTQTHTPTDAPFVLTPVAHNDDWQIIERTINGVEMVLVPPGTFTLGANDEQLNTNIGICYLFFSNCDFLRDEHPTANIPINMAFWIDKTEVTNATYRGSGDTLPVVNVDWNEGAAHCATRSARLPTEVEWEYAASGVDNWNYPWGNTWDTGQNYANICDDTCTESWQETAINDGYRELAPAGQYPAGASWVGALDMVGNVWEYTSTIYAPYPYYATLENPADTSSLRTLRGGAWTWIRGEATTSARATGIAPRTGFYGFRCVRYYQDGDLTAYSE
jgi:formylglycine-generating enzyme required for sulfatase activity